MHGSYYKEVRLAVVIVVGAVHPKVNVRNPFTSEVIVAMTVSRSCCCWPVQSLKSLGTLTTFSAAVVVVLVYIVI